MNIYNCFIASNTYLSIIILAYILYELGIKELLKFIILFLFLEVQTEGIRKNNHECANIGTSKKHDSEINGTILMRPRKQVVGKSDKTAVSIHLGKSETEKIPEKTHNTEYSHFLLFRVTCTNGILREGCINTLIGKRTPEESTFCL